MKSNLKLDDQFVSSMKHWRHHLHAHPELGFEEFQTSQYVAGLLKDWGLEVHENIGGTGIVANLRKGNGERSIGLRADMDALPIQEINEIEYRSVHPGVMHACGHDGHTTMLLAAAKYLQDFGKFEGTVRFIFQPAEEHGKGALAMINDGLFERFNIDEIYGMHNLPGLPISGFATRQGTLCASESLFEISIKSQGGHAAMPHTGVDAITVGAEIVNTLQTVVSRKIDPAQAAVVSVTEFISDGSRNVLPGHALLKGDVRALDSATRKRIEQKMRQITQGIAKAHEVEINFGFENAFIELINSDQTTKHALAAANTVSQDVDGASAAKTFSEDFAHFTMHRPGCFMLIGNGVTGSHGQPLHSADYNFNDQTLVPGLSYWVSLVEQRLKANTDV